MKQTTFEVSVELNSESPADQFSAVIDKLRSLSGVENAQGGPGTATYKIFVQIIFASSDQAEKIQRKVMGILTKTSDLRVTGLKTTVSDVYGGEG